MIPILFSSVSHFASKSLTNGLGRLSDCISFKVTEERNGIFEAEFVYPITGIHYHDIGIGRVVYIIHDASRNPQPFVVYKMSEAIDGFVTYNAHHIAYTLNDIVVMPDTIPSSVIGTPQAILEGLLLMSILPCSFTFYSDILTTGTLEVSKPETIMKLIVGSQNSVVGLFGGELQYDAFTVKLWQSRGEDHGVSIRYGREMTDFRRDVNAENIYNGCVPYWINGSTMVSLSEGYILATDKDPDDPIKLAPMDLTSDFGTRPTETQLRTLAQSKLDGERVSALNIKVSFEMLKQSPEYEDMSALQDVLLCDTVYIWATPFRTAYQAAKVIKTEYDALNEKYTMIELGQPQASLAQTITSPLEEQIEELRKRIDYITSTV